MAFRRSWVQTLFPFQGSGNSPRGPGVFIKEFLLGIMFPCEGYRGSHIKGEFFFFLPFSVPVNVSVSNKSALIETRLEKSLEMNLLLEGN